MDEEIQTEPLVTKPSRADRLKKSIAARLRRKQVKAQKELHSYKIEKEAKQRISVNKYSV